MATITPTTPSTTPLTTPTEATTTAAATPEVAAATPIDGVDAVVDTSAIEGPSTVGAASVPGIAESFPVAALEKLAAKGVRGDTFMLDAGSLRGLELMVRRVKDGDEVGFEIMFKLHESKLGALLKQLENKEAKSAPVVFRGAEEDEDGIARYTAATSEISTSSTHAPKDIDGKPKQWALVIDGPKGGKLEVVHDKAALALRGLVRIHLRGDDKASTKQLDGMIKGLGLGHLFAPPTPKSKRVNMLMRALWQADQKKAVELTKGDADKLKPADLEKALKDAGFTDERIAGLRYEEVFAGHFTVVDPQQAEDMAKAGARYLYSTVTKPEHVHSMLTGGQKASLQRFKEGMIITGMSTNADFITGGAVGVFTRLVTQNAIYSNGSWSGRTYKLLQNYQQLARTDWHGWNGDFYGRRWELDSGTNFGVALVNKIDESGSYKSSNELIFTSGNTPSNVDRVIATSDSDRTKLIEHLTEQGFTPTNGLSLEEFVVLSPKFLVYGPSPFECTDPATFATEALEKAKGGDTAQLQWFLMEGPNEGGGKAKVEQEILLGADTKVQDWIYKAAKLNGVFAMTPAQLGETIGKLQASEDSKAKNVLNQLTSQTAEALFRSNDDTAAALLESKKPSASSYSPFGLDDNAWVRVFHDLADKQTGDTRSKSFSLALDIRAQQLLQNDHAGFKAFLAEHPLVQPADPKTWIPEQIAKIKESNAGAGELALYLAGVTNKKQLAVVQRQLMAADHAETLKMLQTTLNTDKTLFMTGAATLKVMEALPETSATKKWMLSSMGEALLKTGEPKFLGMLQEQFKNQSYNKDFGIYADGWERIATALLDRSKNEVTPHIRAVLEVGGSKLVSTAEFPKRLAKMEDLYELTDAKTFVDEALKQMTVAEPGALKLAWALMGPLQTEAMRPGVVAAIAMSGKYEANQVIDSLKGKNDGKLPFKDEQVRELVKTLDAEESKTGINYVLSSLGRQVLETATKDMLPLLEKHIEGSNLQSKFGLYGQVVQQVVEALDAKGGDAKAVGAWVLKQGAKPLLTANDANFISYLDSKKIALADLDQTPQWAAELVKDVVKSNDYYWTNDYYKSQAHYQTMPAGALWAVKPGGKFSEPVLEAIEKEVKGWGLKKALFDAFLERLPELPDDWKARLEKAYKGE